MKAFLWQMLRKGKEQQSAESPEHATNQTEPEPLSRDVSQNEQTLRKVFHLCSDIVFRFIAGDGQSDILIVYADGLVDTNVLDQSILRPLMADNHSPETQRSIGKVIEEQLVFIGQTKVVNHVQDVVHEVLKGQVAILADGENNALLADASGFEKRAIEESKVESVVQGPRDSFTESLRTNTMLLRRRIPSPRLKFESMTIGELTRTQIVLTYIEHLADSDLIDVVRQRLSNIRMKEVMDAGYIDEEIQDNPRSPFPQIQKTERPDTTAASLLEGKVAIIADCSPSVLIVPTTFWVGIQSADDYYERFDFVVVRKFVRYTMMIISLILPAAYVTVTTYNPDMLPGSLYVSIAIARERSPFPTVIELAMMDFIFEGLTEAGIRMPSQLGPVVSIVGALVVGEAAVRANIVSAPIVIVVALTGIASYGIPRFGFAIPFRLLRFVLLIMAGIYGLYGLSLGVIAILIHMVTLESFGTVYLSPIAPLIRQRVTDVFFRTARWSRGKR